MRKLAALALLFAPAPALAAEGSLPLALEWYAVPGAPNGPVSVLFATDIGDGLALYVGGKFDLSGGLPTANIARLGSAGWAALAGGVNGKVRHLSTYDDGGGVKLVVLGEFTLAGGLAAEGIAFWDGSSWSTPPPGLGIAPNAAAQYDGPLGRRLAVAGQPPDPYGTTTPRALWFLGNSGWSSVVTYAPLLVDLVAHDAGAGPELFAAADYAYVERWSDTAHSQMSVPQIQPIALRRVPEGNGHALLLGGFDWVMGTPHHASEIPIGDAIARLGPNGWQAEWHNLGSLGSSSEHMVWAIEPWNGPFGPTLVVAGSFQYQSYSFVEVPSLVQRAQTEAGTGFEPIWVGVGNSPSGVHCLKAVELGGSSVLFAAGQNLTANGQSLGTLAVYGGGAQALPSWESIPTCSQSLYTLRTSLDHAVIGTSLKLEANGPYMTWGMVAIAIDTGIETGPTGCGIEIDGIGDWLLSGTSDSFWMLSVGPTYGPSVGSWDWSIPASPALLGTEIAMQGLSSHMFFGQYGTTNAMRVRVGM